MTLGAKTHHVGVVDDPAVLQPEALEEGGIMAPPACLSAVLDIHLTVEALEGLGPSLLGAKFNVFVAGAAKDSGRLSIRGGQSGIKAEGRMWQARLAGKCPGARNLVVPGRDVLRGKGVVATGAGGKRQDDQGQGSRNDTTLRCP
jgi:hypothetical protein